MDDDTNTNKNIDPKEDTLTKTNTNHGLEPNIQATLLLRVEHLEEVLRSLSNKKLQKPSWMHKYQL